MAVSCECDDEPYHKMRGIFLLAEDLLASQERLLYMERSVFTMNGEETAWVSISSLPYLQQMPSR